MVQSRSKAGNYWKSKVRWTSYLEMQDHLRNMSKGINGAVTTQGRKFPTNNTGFSFVNCIIRGTDDILLGRAWVRVVFANTYMSNIVASEGWNDPIRDQTVFYEEYKCTGEGANMRIFGRYGQFASYIYSFDRIPGV